MSKALPGPIIPSHQPRPFGAYAVAVFGRESVTGAFDGRNQRDPGRMGVAAERVADEDDIVTREGEGPVGLVRHPDRVQLASAIQRHWSRQVEVLRFDTADRPSGEPGQCHEGERSRCIVNYPDGVSGKGRATEHDGC